MRQLKAMQIAQSVDSSLEENPDFLILDFSH